MRTENLITKSITKKFEFETIDFEKIVAKTEN